MEIDTLEIVEEKGKSYKYAGFWLRFLAWLLDVFIMFGVVSFVWAIFYIPILPGYKDFGGFIFFRNPLGVFCGWLFYTLFEISNFQATPGKMILGLKVVDENFEKISFGKATGRHFGKIISGLTLGIGFLMAGFTERKQGLHDKFVKTLVVRELSEIKHKRTISLIILLISFILFIVSLKIPANTSWIESQNNFDNLMDNYRKHNKVSSTYNFSYKGLSFDYPSSFKVEKKIIEGGMNITCEKGLDNLFDIILINFELESKNWLKSVIETIREEPTHKNANVSEIYTTNYKGNFAVSVDFSIRLLGEKAFGQIVAFNSNGKAVLILKQAGSKDKLKTEFKIIEKSLKIQ
ncbi:MAG: RDD family protein [Flavobacteriaceae bacterium]|nr:RDD family protein [Flavobacteriaceae bacterium]